MNTTRIEVAFDSPETVKSLFGTTQIVESGGKNSARMSLESYSPGKGFGIEEIVLIAFQIPLGIGASYFASWLYEKLNTKAKYIKFKGEVYLIDKDEIERFLANIKGTGTSE